MLDCERALTLINDFLDGALGAAQSVEVTTHLDRCRSCRREYQALKATLAMLRSARTPPGDEARDRVLARFRQSIAVAPSPSARVFRRNFAPVGFGAMVAATALALLFARLQPSMVSSDRLASVSGRPDTLPSRADLEQMSVQHTLQSMRAIRDASDGRQSDLADGNLW